MKRKLLRAASLLLMLALLSCALIGCADGEDELIPENMKYATTEGAMFRLFVPLDWNLLLENGISGAYISSQNIAVVFARTLDNAEGLAIDRYILDVHVKTLAEAFSDDSVFAMTEPTKTLLGGKMAYYVDYSGMRNWDIYCGRDVLCQNGDTLYLLSFCALEEVYEGYAEVRDNITAQFLFSDTPYIPDEPINTVDTAAEAPEGMMLASNDDVAYRFYVPDTWVLDRSLATSSAYVSENDRSNVNVTVHLPDEDSITAEEYWALCVEQMSKTLADMQVLSTIQTTLDGRPANTYTFSATVDGTSYRFAQTIATYRGMVYTLTYTAVDNVFDSHMKEYEAILAAFDFRGN